MADSNITLSGLTCQYRGTFNDNRAVVVRWLVNNPNAGSLYYLDLAFVEVWHNTGQNNRAAAILIGEGFSMLTHIALTRGYYWVRARNNAGKYGDWFPLEQNKGIRAVDLSDPGGGGGDGDSDVNTNYTTQPTHFELYGF